MSDVLGWGTTASATTVSAKAVTAKLRLYIARMTPNSIRAERNLYAGLNEMGDTGAAIAVEIVDVFMQPKRAVVDGIIVTPTLVILSSAGRMTILGDLADGARLKAALETLRESFA